jgi:iron complex transport system substrate-binding protein
MKSSPVIPVFTLLLMLASESPAEILVRDDLQNIVQLEAPAGRIISLAPHLTELLFSLEVGEQIVGTSRYSDYPPAASQIQVIGDAFSVNVETVVNLKPDVIFAWSTGGANRAIESLRKLGYAIYLNEAKTFQGIGKTLVAMSKLVGKERQGLELEGQFQNRIEGIREANAGFPSPRVFFQISDQGLYTVNGQHLIGQAINICNGENVFAEQTIAVPLVSKESIVAADPDVIVISKPHPESVSPWEKRWNSYAGYGAKLRWIDPGLISRPSLRMLDGIEQLCGLIHQYPGTLHEP